MVTRYSVAEHTRKSFRHTTCIFRVFLSSPCHQFLCSLLPSLYNILCPLSHDFVLWLPSCVPLSYLSVPCLFCPLFPVARICFLPTVCCPQYYVSVPCISSSIPCSSAPCLPSSLPCFPSSFLHSPINCPTCSRLF